MKKSYQTPEIDILISTSKYSVMDKSNGAIGPGTGGQGGIDANSSSFDEDELNTDVKSSLWDN